MNICYLDGKVILSQDHPFSEITPGSEVGPIWQQLQQIEAGFDYFSIAAMFI
jgi:hypothetical protein